MKTTLMILISLLICGCAVKNIHTAAIDQNIKEVTRYLDEGESIDETDRYGFTPLIYAAYYGRFPMVKFLCTKGADVNRQNQEGQSALLYAAYYNHVRIAEVLLKHGADPNLVNNYGYNALEYAKNYQFDHMIDLLERYGAKPLY